MTLHILHPPSRYPVSLEEAKAYLRISHSEMDEQITAQIKATTSVCEKETGLALIRQHCYVFLDGWPDSKQECWWDGIRQGTPQAIFAQSTSYLLPIGPVLSLDEIALLDEDGNARTISPMPAFVTSDLPARLVRRSGMRWPAPLRARSGIRILLTAGFGDDAATVPFVLREAILQLIAHRLDHPAMAAIPDGVKNLWSGFRRVSL